jgi:hypothetical protein
MNRDFNPSKRNVRSVFACAAVLTALLVLGSIDSLSRHYGAEADIAAAAHAVKLAANSAR